MADDVVAESLISLEYPNGRIHHATLVGKAFLRPGEEFDLHGRRWRVAEPARYRRRSHESTRILCRPVAPSRVPESETPDPRNPAG
jgi:hypothetical protein